MVDQDLPPTPTLNDSVIWGVVASLTILVNSIQIHILRNIVKRKAHETLLLSFSICTLLTGIFGFFTVTLTSIRGIKIHFYTIWAFFGIMYAYLSLVSILHLIIISISRLWDVACPLHNRSLENDRKQPIRISILSWCVPMTFISGYIVVIQIKVLDIYGIIHYNRRVLASILAVFVLVADLVFLVCYSIISAIIFDSRKYTKSRRQTHMMRTLLLCVGFAFIFITCTTPFVITTISDWNKSVWLDKTSIGLLLLKGIMYPSIYLAHKCRLRFLKRKRVIPIWTKKVGTP